ncbi:MAG: TIGR03118 family protein [Acidobacteria bacterium]|nr:TIGR03118 family protein [Acidobacteriota bacterium]
MKTLLTVSTLAVWGAMSLGAQPRSNVYISKNLVSDLPGQGERKDPNLVNPWGIAFSPTGPFWVANAGSGLSTVYNTRGEASPLVVRIPVPPNRNPPSKPTGIVFHGGNGFDVSMGLPARFLFATEDGTITAWNPQADESAAFLKVDNSGAAAVYKGLALASFGGNEYLYATNFFSGQIEVFNSSFGQVALPPGRFLDGLLPPGFAPFNIQNIGGELWVTYALQDAQKHDDVAGAGNGFVNVFTPDGVLTRRFAQQGPLNSPWGITMAPADFGEFSGAILVGNFGDGRINAYNAQSGLFLGQMLEPSGRELTIDGLWALIFGNGGQGGEAGLLYFTAGINHEQNGVFGRIKPQHPGDTSGN